MILLTITYNDMQGDNILEKRYFIPLLTLKKCH